MTTALDIIVGGYRETNLTGINSTLSDAEKDQGLSLLNDILSSALGFDISEKLIDWPVGNVNYANGLPGWTEYRWSRPWANHRLIVNVNSPQTIFMPLQPDNGARIALVDVLGNLSTYPITLDGNGRNVEGAPQLVLNTDGLNKAWLYRADLANWVAETTLTIGDDMPYPPAFDSFFKVKLAMRIDPRYGRSMSAESVAELANMESRLRSAYRQRVVTPCDLAVQVLGVQVYNAGLGYGRPRGAYGWME